MSSDELVAGSMITRDEIKVKLLENLKNYRNMMNLLAGDAPISVLCLPKIIEKLLIGNGCLRVYDMLNCNLGEIKGLTNASVNMITARLEQFRSMSS